MEVFSEAKGVTKSMQSLKANIRNYIRRKLIDSKHDLTYEMLQVLNVLWRSGELNQQEIADQLSKNKASLTSLLDNLAKRDIIKRTEDANDRRSKIISLTALGRAYEKDLDVIMSEFYARLQTGLSKEELAGCSAVLKKMEDNLWK